jgi:AcrR family transcriptional regulator
LSVTRGSDTRARIQQTALELFMEQGFAATSLQQIADRIGVTKAALYYHFPSKADLAKSIFQPWKEDLDRFLEDAEAREDRSPRELVSEAFDVLVRHRDAFAVAMIDASILMHVDLVTWTEEWAERLQRLFIGPDPTIYQRTRVAVAFGGLNDAVFLLRRLPVEEVKPAAIDAVCGAIGIDERSMDPTSPRDGG